MLVPPLPKSWLIHTVGYERYLGKDRYGEASFADSVTINFVRVDMSTVFSRDNMQTKVLAEGVVYIDAQNSTPLSDFVDESKIVFDGRVFTVKKVATLYHPNSDSVHHWELEVI